MIVIVKIYYAYTINTIYCIKIDKNLFNFFSNFISLVFTKDLNQIH